MAKQMSKLDIMNVMGQAANKKSQMMGQNAAPQDEEDPLNSEQPMANQSPANPNANPSSKRVAAAKEQEKAKGKMPPKTGMMK